MPGRVGDQLEGPGAPGQWVGVRVLWVLDPADDVFAAEGIGVPAGQRSLVVASEFTNLVEDSYVAPPDVGLVVVDAHGDRHGRAVATLTAYPRFRHVPVDAGMTVAGHTYFVLPLDAPLRHVEWTAALSDEDPALTWLL